MESFGDSVRWKGDGLVIPSDGKGKVGRFRVVKMGRFIYTVR